MKIRVYMQSGLDDDEFYVDVDVNDASEADEKAKVIAEQYYASKSTWEVIDEMVKPTRCPCGELFDAKDSSFCPKCGCAYGELSGRYTNIGR